jgi:hypothetical protein
MAIKQNPDKYWYVIVKQNIIAEFWYEVFKTGNWDLLQLEPSIFQVNKLTLFLN